MKGKYFNYYFTKQFTKNKLTKKIGKANAKYLRRLHAVNWRESVTKVKVTNEKV